VNSVDEKTRSYVRNVVLRHALRGDRVGMVEVLTAQQCLYRADHCPERRAYHLMSARVTAGQAIARMDAADRKEAKGA
jgi:hypothetical protein